MGWPVSRLSLLRPLKKGRCLFLCFAGKRAQLLYNEIVKKEATCVFVASKT